MSYLDKLKAIHKIKAVLEKAFGSCKIIFIKDPSFYKLRYGDIIIRFEDEQYKKLIEKLVVDAWKDAQKYDTSRGGNFYAYTTRSSRSDR